MSETPTDGVQHKARLKCPVCGLTYGVAGIYAIGVSNGESIPCSRECAKQAEDDYNE